MTNASRRNFLKATGAVAAAAIAGPRLSAAPLSFPIGLQLYSVRALMPNDLAGTLSKVAACGYKEVEAAGYFGHSAKDFRHAVEEAGMRLVSTHHSMGELRPKLDELIEFNHELGVDYLICPSPTRRDPSLKGMLDLADWRWVAGELNRIGQKVKAAGMTFGYHNHGPEFGKEGGVVFYDELLRLTDPSLVVFEMDCGWVASAGRNPVDYLSKTPERFPLLHVKDMVKGASGEYHSTVMGRGVVDYHATLRAAKGLKHYFIEQEEFDIDTFEALRLDAEYMRKLDV